MVNARAATFCAFHTRSLASLQPRTQDASQHGGTLLGGGVIPVEIPSPADDPTEYDSAAATDGFHTDALVPNNTRVSSARSRY